MGIRQIIKDREDIGKAMGYPAASVGLLGLGILFAARNRCLFCGLRFDFDGDTYGAKSFQLSHRVSEAKAGRTGADKVYLFSQLLPLHKQCNDWQNTGTIEDACIRWQESTTGKESGEFTPDDVTAWQTRAARLNDFQPYMPNLADEGPESVCFAQFALNMAYTSPYWNKYLLGQSPAKMIARLNFLANLA